MSQSAAAGLSAPRNLSRAAGSAPEGPGAPDRGHFDRPVTGADFQRFLETKGRG